MLTRRNEIPHVNPPEILWENKIGTGRFGTVYLVNHEQERADLKMVIIIVEKMSTL